MKHLLQNKILNGVLKIILFGGLMWILYKQLFSKEEVEIAVAHFWKNFHGNYLLLFSVIILMLLNWSIEAIKWKLLIDKLHPISWLKAVEGILFGVTFSLFTPSRVGEFGGRVFALNTERKEAIVATIIGSLAQIVVNFSFGALGLLLYGIFVHKLSLYLVWTSIFLFLLLLFLLHFCFYNLDVISNKFSTFPILKKVYKYIHVIDLYNNADFFRLELYSFFRYLIYCLQFVLLLYFFGFEIPIALAMILTASIFFVQTINPINIALIDFGFRGNVAVFFLSAFANNPISILAATITLWLINLIFPAIIGGFAALRFKFFVEE
ncbi:MAG: flippase-like domain-containing protein [Bacteroidetes bacterium]|nr:flippase-like domain-containing protein [Bacteroidota bacterium]